MSMTKKLLLTGICTAILLILSHYAFVAFAADSDEEVKVRRIEMAMETATVRVNQERTLFVEVFPYNATDKTIEWTSGNPEIVMVEGDGTIIGISPGTTEITATSHNGRSAVCTVTVPSAVLTEIEQQVQNSEHPLAEASGGELLSAATLRLDVENAATAKENRQAKQITLAYAEKTQVSTAALRSAAFTASYHSKKAVLRFRTLDEDGKIQGQLTIYPEDTGENDAEIRLGVYASASKTEQAKSQAMEYFGASAAAVRLAQQGDFPIAVQLAAKVDFTGLDTQALKIYHYADGVYTLLENQEYRIDANGYIHFSVFKGGTYVFAER